MVNSKKRIIAMLSFLAFLFIFVLGISYAYYAAEIKGNLSDNPSLKLTSGYLSMVYDGGSTSISGGSTEGTTNDLVYTKNFTVTNNGVADSNFGIWIKNYTVKDKNGIETTLARPEDWTYTLKSGDIIIKSGKFVTEDEALISVYPLAIGETKSLTLTLTYNYITTEEGGTDQTADMGKVLSFDIVVVQSIDHLTNTSEGTLLYAINNDYQSSVIRNETDLTTIPGQAASLETESIMATTEDDYGTSYYYRGNVQNNYVTYSNMCWRIVRVQGNGDIKLTLADGNHPCGTANGYRVDDTDSAFVAEYTKYFSYNDNPTGNESDFLFENSNIEKVLAAWAGITNDRTYTYYPENTTATFTNEILDTTKLSTNPEWCIDTSIKKQDFLNSNYEKVEADSNLIKYTETYYGASVRLKNAATAAPTLKCNMKGLNNTSTKKYTDSAIGLLTIDEVAFAGASSIYVNNHQYYLGTNSSANMYLTMTPEDNREAYGINCVFYISGSTIGDIGDINATVFSIRPAVILRSDVTLSTETDYVQDGTIDKPYVID